MSEINGIVTDPMAKVAQALVRHQEKLEDHDRRISELEQAREEHTRAYRNFTWAFIVQAALFVLNLLANLAMRR